MTPVPSAGSPEVMANFVGATPAQALRVQALLRLGVSEEDVRVAERFMSPKSVADSVSSLLEKGVKVQFEDDRHHFDQQMRPKTPWYESWLARNGAGSNLNRLCTSW